MAQYQANRSQGPLLLLPPKGKKPRPRSSIQPPLRETSPPRDKPTNPSRESSQTPTQRAGWRSPSASEPSPSPAPPPEGEETKAQSKHPRRHPATRATPRDMPTNPSKSNKHPPNGPDGAVPSKSEPSPSPAPPPEGEETKAQIKHPAATPRHGPSEGHANQPLESRVKHPPNGPDGAVPSKSEPSPSPAPPPEGEEKAQIKQPAPHPAARATPRDGPLRKAPRR